MTLYTSCNKDDAESCKPYKLSHRLKLLVCWDNGSDVALRKPSLHLNCGFESHLGTHICQRSFELHNYRGLMGSKHSFLGPNCLLIVYEVGTSGGLLWTHKCTMYRYKKRTGSSWLNENCLLNYWTTSCNYTFIARNYFLIICLWDFSFLLCFSERMGEHWREYTF